MTIRTFLEPLYAKMVDQMPGSRPNAFVVDNNTAEHNAIRRILDWSPNDIYVDGLQWIC